MNFLSPFSAALRKRPLAQGLVLALSGMALGPALAGELDGSQHTVVEGDAAEAWSLINGAALQVSGGQTLTLEAEDTSQIQLQNATIQRGGSSQRAITLRDDASLVAQDSRLLGGSVLIGGQARADFTNSVIRVTRADGLRPGEILTVGVDMVDLGSASGINGYARIDNSLILVEDADVAEDRSSGIGLRMSHGTADLLNGTRVDAANNAVLMFGSANATTPVTLRADDTQLQSGRGAAIRVAARSADRQFDITLANHTRVLAGNGTLLHFDAWSGNPFALRNTVSFTLDDTRVAGDVVMDTTQLSNSTLDLALRNKARIDGRFMNVTNASIGGDSTWLMTGDSNVGRLRLDAGGTVALGNGSAFNTLSLDTFTGAGGTLLFNTRLGDDTSLTDRLAIAGDANGHANVRVLNAGGTGAKTDHGIELIDIGGASNARFDLVGRAVGGQYEYFLVKDTNGNWYLRSEQATAPDPCVTDPSLPGCTPIDPVDPVDPVDPIEPPAPILRPETGAYLANQFALDRVLRHTYRDRQGGAAAADGIRGWARVDATNSKLGAVDDQLDLRVDRSRLQLGADIGVFDDGRGRVGLMGTAARSSVTSRSNVTGYSARGKLDGGAVGAYGNWASDGLYVDASVQRGQFRNRVQGEGLAEERYDSDIWQSSVEAGYRVGIGQIGTTALSLQPELQLIYTDATTEVHTEANGTVVRAAGSTGLSGRAGLRLQGESRAAVGASVSPYLAANWYRDGAGNGIAFDDEVLKAGIPRNRYELSAGARVEFRSGFSAWGGLGVMRGDHGYREAAGNLSVAYTW